MAGGYTWSSNLPFSCRMQLLSKSSLPFRIYLAGSCLGTILEIFKWDIVGSIIFWKYFDVSYFLQSTYSVTEVKTLSSGDGLEIQWKDGHKSMWVVIHNLQPVSLTRYEIKNTVWLFSTSFFFSDFITAGCGSLVSVEIVNKDTAVREYSKSHLFQIQ